MCSTLYHFCADCNTFYPSNRQIKIKKRRCQDGPRCKNNKRMLLDHRHETCKPIKKKWFATKKEPEDVLLPVQETMVSKLRRIDEKRQQRRAQNGLSVEASQSVAMTSTAEAATASTESTSSSATPLSRQEEVRRYGEEVFFAPPDRTAERFALFEQDNEFWRGEDLPEDYWTDESNPWAPAQQDLYFLPYEFLSDN